MRLFYFVVKRLTGENKFRLAVFSSLLVLKFAKVKDLFLVKFLTLAPAR